MGPCEAATVAKKQENVMGEGQLIVFLITKHAHDYGAKLLICQAIVFIWNVYRMKLKLEVCFYKEQAAEHLHHVIISCVSAVQNGYNNCIVTASSDAFPK